MFYKCDNGHIYKKREKVNDYLKCTPWVSGEDRRVNEEFIQEHQGKRMKEHAALFEINEQWRNTTFHWKHNNKKYEARGEGLSHSPWHTWHHSRRYKDYKGVERLSEWDEKWKLASYQGKLVWVNPNTQYFPQMWYTQFKDYNTEPSYCDRGGWTNIKCVKGVYCVTDKEYI